MKNYLKWLNLVKIILYGEYMNELQQINDKISSLFDSGNPFSVVRIGNMEGYFIDCFFRKTAPLEEFHYWLSLTSGVYPMDVNYLTTIWLQENINAIDNADALGFVDVSGEVERNKVFVDTHCSNKFSFYGVKKIEILDPGILLNKDIISNPWTKNLKGKKVLVVSSHVNTIKQQWKKMKDIWGEHLEEIAPFDLVDVVRSPFHPQMDDRQYENCTSWDQTLNHMKNLIDQYEYDVLLVGAAAYSPALADHAKRKGKIGITLCGAIQLYFGILGSRWTTQDYYKDWLKLFNENWIYTLESDLPRNRHIFDRFEKAYW